ncbi:MAG: hypothetical protein HY922_16675 [Elusimicrobia bacterium]|nr:hypothetical protein [Elusimicrobiota bacterium]
MNSRITHEFRIRLALTPRAARWVLPVFICLAFPIAAGPVDEPLTTNYLPSPSGIYGQLVVAKGVTIGTKEAISLGAQASIDASNGNVGMGTSSFDTYYPQLRVAGNLKVTHCIFLKTNSRCSWDPD